MKILGYVGAILCAALLGTSAAQAQIIAELESPTQLQNVSGLALVRGFAFVEGEEDADVTVQPVIDGVIQEDMQIPCCTAREDVQNNFGGDTPLNTGFAALINYGELSAGPHTVGVIVFAEDEDFVPINRSVVVVRPGNVAFVENLSLAGATCSVEGEELVITGAQVDSTTTDLRAGYATDLQALVITEASGVPAVTNFEANLTSNQVVPVVDTDSEGFATVLLNPDNTLTYTVTTTDVEVGTTAEIRQAPAGEPGPVVFTLDGGPDTWQGTTGPLTEDQLTALQQASLYILVNSTENPGGELRGQLVAAPLL